ncbi:hypothetical protein BDW66DRAFT_94249 [Aspergillus desertorum]
MRWVGARRDLTSSSCKRRHAYVSEREHIAVLSLRLLIYRFWTLPLNSILTPPLHRLFSSYMWLAWLPGTCMFVVSERVAFLAVRSGYFT